MVGRRLLLGQLFGVFFVLGCAEENNATPDVEPNVDAIETTDSMSASGSGGVTAAGETRLNPSCFEACLAKGLGNQACQDACAANPTDGKIPKPDEDGAAGPRQEVKQPETDTDARRRPDGEGRDGGEAPRDEDEVSDEADEEEWTEEDEETKREQIEAKNCIACWEEQALGGVCAEQLEACEDSLACTQLQWCPVLCDEGDCVSECNEIIPSGVPILTALVQCMACADGPCASECEDSILLNYCRPQ